MDYSAKTHRFAYPGCNTRETLHRWVSKPIADLRLYFSVACHSRGLRRAGGWVEDRKGNRDIGPAMMAHLAKAAPGRWSESIRGGKFGVECVCGFSAATPCQVKRHLCREWAAITMGGTW